MKYLPSLSFQLAPVLLSLALLATPFTAHAAVAPAPGAAACPAALEQLPELLASSMQRIDREAALRVEFEVDASGRVRPLSVTGARRYHSPVRLALASLDCHGGVPQRYAVDIQFSGSPQRGASQAPQIEPGRAVSQAER